MTINYSKQVLLKRGNTAVSTTYTGPVGEITLDTDLLQIRVHDGTTQGGWVIPSGQDFIDIQTDLAIIANIDTSLLANVSTLLANANVQQTQIDNVISNLAELVTVGNTVPSTANETFWFNDGDGRLYIKQANVWTDASPSVLPSPAYIFSTLENTAGNIVPDASNVYSLGSSVAQWKDLWVSNATIYFNSVPLSTDVSGNLTYNGNPLVSLIDGNLSVGDAAVGLNPFDQDLNANSAVTFYTVGATAINVSQINGTNPGNELVIQAGGSKNWIFGTDGNLTLPGGGAIDGSDYDVDIIAGNDGVSTFGHISFTANGPNGLNSLTYNSLGEITVVTAGANDGLIKWVGNSSGDGAGYTTMVMVPDTTVEGNDQYIIIDPTIGQPGHIHIRAGGTQDNSQAVLILGGETSHFRVESGLDPDVYIRSNNNDWTFGTDGNLTLGKITPHGGINRGIVWDWGLGQAALGLGEGEGSNSYIRQTENGLEIHPNEPGGMGDGDLRIRTGNVSPGGTSYDWIFNGSGGLTFPTGGNVTFDSSSTSIIDGITNINAVGTIGANVVQVLSDLTSFGASPAPRIYGFSSIATTGSAVNEGNISASGNLVASQNAYVSGNVFATQYNFANGVNIFDTITGVTSINSSVATSTISDESGDFSYGSLSYDYDVNGVTAGGFTISYSAPLVHGNVDVNVGNVIATNVTVSGNLTVDNTLVNRVYLLEAYASETYTLPGSFTEDPCRYSYISNTVNVPSAWFNTSTYTFTPLKAGYWEITAAYDVYRNAESSMAIKKNTTIVASAGSFNAVAQQVTKIIYLNGSTDYIQIYNYGGAALERSQYETRSWFQARWVGA